MIPSCPSTIPLRNIPAYSSLAAHSTARWPVSGDRPSSNRNDTSPCSDPSSACSSRAPHRIRSPSTSLLSLAASSSAPGAENLSCTLFLSAASLSTGCLKPHLTPDPSVAPAGECPVDRAHQHPSCTIHPCSASFLPQSPGLWGNQHLSLAARTKTGTHAPGSSSPAPAPPPPSVCPEPLSDFLLLPPPPPPPASRCLLPVVAISGSGCVDAPQKQRQEPTSITGWGPRIT